MPQAGYESQYFSFVQTNWPGRFATWVEWDNCKNFKHKMTATSLWEPYEAYINQNCEFTNPSMVNGQILSLNASILKMLEFFKDNDNYDSTVLLLLRLAVPTSDGTPWILRTAGEKSGDQGKIKLLKTEMSESKVFRLSKVSADSVATRALAAKNRPKKVLKNPKNSKRAKAKAVAKKPPKAPTKQPGPERVEMTTSDGRPVYLLDDIWNAVNFALRGLDNDAVDTTKVEQIVLLCFEFAMTGSVTVDGTAGKAQPEPLTFCSWSKLRKHIKQTLMSLHKHCPRDIDSDMGSETPKADTQDAANSCEAKGPDAIQALLGFTDKNPKVIAKLTEFLTHNSPGDSIKVVKKIHPALTGAVAQLWREVPRHLEVQDPAAEAILK